MAVDIGSLLFSEILKVQQYPGAPFTGNIINDLVLYFFLPTVLVILIIFVLLGRLAVQQKGIRLLLGIAIYLFIIFGGYFSFFVILGPTYFLLLVFVLGVLYFIPTHFRVRTHGYPHEAAGGVSEKDRFQLAKELQDLDKDIAKLDAQYAKAQQDHNDRLASSIFDKKQALEDKARALRYRLYGGGRTIG